MKDAISTPTPDPAETREQRALRESEARYRALFRGMGQGYCEFELVRDEHGRAVDQRYLLFNPAFERIFGIPEADAVGRTASEVFPDLEPWWTETFERTVKSGKLERIEHKFAALDRWFEVFVYPQGGDRLAVTYEDVTARRRAEEALRESEERLALAIEIGQLASWDWNVATGQVAWSDRHYLIQGYGVGEIEPSFEAWLERVHPDDRAQALALIEQARDKHMVYAHEFRVLRPDGSLRWCSARGQFFYDENGDPVRMIGVMEDATERKQAEEEIRESEERQKFLLRFSDALRAEADVDSVANRAISLLAEQLKLDRCYITNYCPGEDEAVFPYQVGNDSVPPLPAKVRLSDFPEAYEQVRERSFVVEDDFERHGLTDAERANSKALGMRAIVASTARRGEKIPISSMVAVSATPRRWTASEIALVEEAAERTWAAIERARAEAALREREQRFRAFVVASSDVIYRMSPDWTEMRELDGQGLLEDTPEPSENWMERYIHPDDREQVQAAIDEAIAAKSMFELEHRVAGASGDRPWVLSRAVPMLDEHGELTEWLGAATDVTDRKLTEERYHALFNSVDDAFCIVSVLFNADGRPFDYRFLEANAAFERHTGLSDVIGKTALDVVPDLEQIWFDVYARVAVTGEPERFEDEAIAMGRWYDVYAFPFGERDEHQVAILFRDISERKAAEQSAQRQKEHQAFLLMLSDRLRTEADAHAIAATAVTLLAEHMHLDRAYIAQVDKSRDLAVIGPEYRRPDLASVGGTLTLSHFPEAFARVEAGTLVLSDAAADPTLSDSDKQGFAQIAMGALMVASARKGILNPVWSVLAASETPRRWTAMEVKLLEEVVERTWAALERARAEKILADDLVNAERLRSLSERLVTEESFAAIYDEVLTATVAIARADAGTIQIYNPATKALELIASLNFSRGVTDYFHVVDAGSRTACGIALKTGQCAFVDFPDVEGDLGCQLLVGEGFQSALALPLVLRTGEPLAMLNTHWRSPRYRPGESDMRFLELLARQAADLIEHRRAQSALQESEERLRQFGEASQDILWMRDAEALQWTYLTPAFETIYGLSREQALEGNNYRSWMELIVPEDRERVSEEVRRVRNGEHVTFDYRIKRPLDGELRWIRNTDFPITDANGKVTLIGGIGHDLTELRATGERAQLLLAELQHRVRNIMAMVRSVVRQSSEGSDSVEDFVAHLVGRLDAMARTQGLLTRAPGAQVNLEDLVREELHAQIADETRLTIRGAEVGLSPKAAEVLTLAVHELATNSVKYGALSSAQGRLAIAWEQTHEGSQAWLSFTWQEWCRTPDAGSIRAGFGTELIEERVPYELRGRASLQVSPGGVRAEIAFPLGDGSSILETGDVRGGRP